MQTKPIYVTHPSMPPLEEFIPYLDKIWESGVLTNNGDFHKKLEAALCEYLGVKYISLFCNGTVALITALKALEIKGEVITTPFSFVASAHALKWNGLKPVFSDIDPDTYNLDPKKIESSITGRTTAILPVHVYGIPCDDEAIKKIADRYGLKVIYDAAHAFGVKKNSVSILNSGDLSVLSFHATKIYNTFEGGAIVCHDEKTKDKIDKLKNFGFAGETKVIKTGINGKMNEFQAAFGLLHLRYVGANILKLKKLNYFYREMLKNIKGIKLLNEVEGITYNYSYFPILVDKNIHGKSRDEVYTFLKDNGIYCRRYFYPLITDFPMYKNNKRAASSLLQTAEMVAQEVLCLPIYPDLQEKDVKEICGLIMQIL